MTSPVCTLDLARMRRARIDKLRTAMAAAGIDTLVLCNQSNVSYATGARVPASDHVRASWWRAIAVIERTDPSPHLFTEFPEGSPSDLPNDHLHPAIEVEAAAGAAELVARLPGGTLGVDDAPFPLWQALRAREVLDGNRALAPAKLTKTIDELECIRQAQAINERAIRSARAVAQPGALATDLSGAFLRAIAELGATSNTVDPVFQVMPRSVAAGPASITGEPVFPLPTRPRELASGDVLWVDTGINLNGYSSDFGATWIVGGEPDGHARAQFAEWRATVDRVLEATKPGATGADLVRVATERTGRRPWLSYFYLAHGIGTDSAEMPLIGTDRGDAFDASIVLQPGMVLVFEPVVWEDTQCGHRSEEIVAITEDGYLWLSNRAELDEGAEMNPELDQCLTEMERRGIDALVLGREANARAVSGADRLWLSGTRPFAPGCVVVRKTAGVHLLANSNDGFEEFPTDHLYPVTWNPAKLLGALRAIPGLTDARTVGVDGMSPAMDALFGELLPGAELADAGPIFAEVWRVPSADKVQAVEEAARVACNGLAAMATFLRDGVRARVLRGVCAERFAAMGVTTPAFEAVAAPIDGGASTWLPPERLLGAGENVALRAGALRNGWEASLARTYVVAEPSVEQPPPDGWADLIALCRTGTRVGHLRDLDAVVYGVGRGVEPYDDDLALEPGMVFALELHRGRRLHQDVLHLTDDGPVTLTS